jgi:small subunit ribosomal protein S16
VYWLQQGAQPSNQVRNLLRISGAWAAFTGEAPPVQVVAAGEPASAPATKAAPKRAVKATPAASVAEDGADEPETAAEPEGEDQDAEGS